jgi:hypothetical protein
LIRGVEKFAYIHELINSVWNKEDLPEEWKELIIVHFYRKCSKTDCIRVAYQVCQLFTKFFQHPAIKIYVNHMQRKLLCIIAVDFDATGQLLIIYSAFIKYLIKEIGIQRSSATTVYRLQESL